MVRTRATGTLGPGSYDLPSGSIAHELTSRRNSRSPPFNASSRRNIKLSGAIDNKVPGPGSYETQEAEALKSQSTQRKGGNGGFGFSRSRSELTMAAANSKCDPGQYAIGNENASTHLGKHEPLTARSARSKNVHAAKGRAGFGSTVPRPSSSPPGARASGGPGEYDSSHLYECGKTAPAVSSSFQSGLPANAHVPKSDTPGVGEYEPSFECGHSRPTSATFKGPERSTSMVRTRATGTLGPGSYDISAGSISHLLFEKRGRNTPSPPFNSSAKRRTNAACD